MYYIPTLANSNTYLGTSILTLTLPDNTPEDGIRLFKKDLDTLEIGIEGKLLSLNFGEKVGGLDEDSHIIKTVEKMMPIIRIDSEDIGAETTFSIRKIVKGHSGAVDFEVDIFNNNTNTIKTKNVQENVAGDEGETLFKDGFVFIRSLPDNGAEFSEIRFRSEHDQYFETSSVIVLDG